MDFVDGLRKSQVYTIIMVVVDRLKKLSHFEPVRGGPTHRARWGGRPTSPLAGPLCLMLAWCSLVKNWRRVAAIRAQVSVLVPDEEEASLAERHCGLRPNCRAQHNTQRVQLLPNMNQPSVSLLPALSFASGIAQMAKVNAVRWVPRAWRTRLAAASPQVNRRHVLLPVLSFASGLMNYIKVMLHSALF